MMENLLTRLLQGPFFIIFFNHQKNLHFINFVRLCEAPLAQGTMSSDRVLTGVNVSVWLIIENMLLRFTIPVCSVLRWCLNHISGTWSTLFEIL